MTAKAKLRQAEIERLVRGAKKAGAKRVRVEPDGTVDIVIEDEHKKVSQSRQENEDDPPPNDGRLLW